MTRRDRPSAPPLRRAFLLHGLAVAGAAAALLARRADAVPEPEATPSGPTASPVTAGYRETRHVRNYYAKARQ